LKNEDKKMTIHLHTSRADGLLNQIVDSLGDFDRRFQRRHELRILSCYLDKNLRGIRALIDHVSEVVRLTDVELMFEMLEIYRGRLPNDAERDLRRLERRCRRREVTFRWIPVRVGMLMHAKSYSVVQRVQGRVGDGVVWISSGNATTRGLGASRARVNVELSSKSTSRRDVADFLDIWGQLRENEIDIAQAFAQDDIYAFAYALLASGVFLHDWRDALRSQLGVRYTLTDVGRRSAPGNNELALLGLDLDRATATRNPFSAQLDFPPARRLPGAFARGYTIDTLLGRWCPCSIWNVVEQTIGQDEAFRQFYDALLSATTPQAMDRLVERESKIEDALVARGLVVPDEERLQRWRGKISWLRKDETRLTRMFLRFEPFELPYDYQAREEIRRLYDSVLESLSFRRRQSVVASKVWATQESRELAALELREDEQAVLETLLQGPIGDEDESETAE
jgi:hypothetical protein